MNNIDMRKRNVKCILKEFDDHTAIQEEENRYVQVNEWINGEGVDINFKDGQKISLSWQQYLTLRTLINNEFLS